MKNKYLLSTLLLIAAAGFTSAAGCDQLKDAANTAKDTVTSMVDKVNTFEMDEDANALNVAAKEFYSGVVAGTITETTKGYLVTAELPSDNATPEERKEAAGNLTILSVLESQGVLARYPEETISDFVSCNGEIKYKGSVDTREVTAIPLSYNMTLSEALNR